MVLEQVRGAALDGDGAEDRGDYRSEEFQYLDNGGPIDFNHNS